MAITDAQMMIAALRGLQPNGVVTPQPVDPGMVVTPNDMWTNQQLDQAEKNEFGPGSPISLQGR